MWARSADFTIIIIINEEIRLTVSEILVHPTRTERYIFFFAFGLFGGGGGVLWGSRNMEYKYICVKHITSVCVCVFVFN